MERGAKYISRGITRESILEDVPRGLKYITRYSPGDE